MYNLAVPCVHPSRAIAQASHRSMPSGKDLIMNGITFHHRGQINSSNNELGFSYVVFSKR